MTNKIQCSVTIKKQAHKQVKGLNIGLGFDTKQAKSYLKHVPVALRDDYQ